MQIPDESKKAGYDPGQKTFFLWEGVTMYISAEAVDSTLQFIATGSAPGSSVVFDYMPLGAVQNDFERYPDIRRLSFWVAYRGGNRLYSASKKATAPLALPRLQSRFCGSGNPRSAPSLQKQEGFRAKATIVPP